jgi:hypothetical protein
MKKLLLFIECLGIVLCSFAQRKIDYTRHDTMIPMRDGVKLYTVYYTPNNTSGPVPVLIQRTPYGYG